jgi:hypothetical protein
MEEGTGIEPETFQPEMFSKHSPKPFSITFLKIWWLPIELNYVLSIFSTSCTPVTPESHIIWSDMPDSNWHLLLGRQ